MTTTRYAPVACLNCGHKLDTAMGTNNEEVPEPGAVSICIKCSHIMLFTNELGMRNPTEEELARIVSEDDVINALIALARMRRQESLET